MQRLLFSILLLFLLSNLLFSQNTQPLKWQISTKNTITKDCTIPQNLPYSDNIELSGKRVAAIVSYEVDTNQILKLKRQVFFPQLHPFIKETDQDWYVYRSYVKDIYEDDILPKLFIGDRQFVPGKLKAIQINGNLNFVHEASKSGLILERTLFPSTDERLFVEHWVLKNATDKSIEIIAGKTEIQTESFGQEGKFSQLIHSDIPSKFTLAAGDFRELSIQIKAKKQDEEFPQIDSKIALEKRDNLLNTFSNSLILKTPNETLNTLFNFAKIRASESIFESKLGLIHSPGGGRYYVGIWANDQAEYVSPFFPYLGYQIGNESALNCYRAFAKEINEDYDKIRYAFEIEGTVPPFLLDRGDAAMIAYGASQFVLANGDKKIGEELWVLIQWCLEYCRQQLNSKGVVNSESDEMEGRIETGTANLSTSALYYGALNLAVDLAKNLGKSTAISKDYFNQAKTLKVAIENYFGAKIEGLETYKYYKEHEYLRHWICLPLVVGIFDRKDATTEALFEKLWSTNGVHVEKNADNEAISKIFWDRGTLYALRGTFLAGATEKSLEKLVEYSEERLLGARVPYPVEAFPEGSMAHLSAESGLYCRIFTEGLFGIVPTGFRSFKMTPRLPKDWDNMSLKNIKAFGNDFDILVERDGEKLKISVITNSNKQTIFTKKIHGNETIFVNF